MKKVIIVGSTGVIGQKIAELLHGQFEIIEVNRSSGQYKVDMQKTEELEAMFKSIGSFDALIATSGYGKWGTIDEHSISDFHDGLNSKLMGQVNLVMIGRKYANPNASFAISSGILAQHPVEGGLSLGMINAAIEAFVRGAAIELKDMTVNAVSPSFAKETMQLMGMDDSTGVPAIEFARLYQQAIESGTSGQIYRV
ncbi:MAG: short chain dehydrogenase [Bacteroidales bacterium]|nr:short chain dehydrogenase [Bacteroidales bacterium]